MTKTDAIVVLGCTVRQNGTPSDALGRRLDLAARAHREGVAPLVVASGGRRWGSHVEAVVMRRELVGRGVPESAVTMELCSLTTSENCWFTAEILRRMGHRRVLLATCSWHLERATVNFRRVAIEAVSPPVAWLTTPPPTWRRRARERVNMIIDWCMMPNERHV